MKATWRWFGPNDPITLRHVAEAGASGIVSSLHQVRPGQPWSLEAILERKGLIEAAGLEWSVVESIPVTEPIKTRSGTAQTHIKAWKESLRALGKAGVRTVCYNFMPIVDWTRTDLAYPLKSGRALRFDLVDFVAYDAFVLRRPHAADDYPPDVVAAAERRSATFTEARASGLERIILAGLPGTDTSYDRATFLKQIATYAGMTADDLRSNLVEFLQEVVPVAEESGIVLGIHPDDPPLPLFGLPRIVSTQADLGALLAAFDSPANGITFCAGSFGSRADNDVLATARLFAARINFMHLRNVRREPSGSFYEDEHLAGDVDIVGLIGEALAEEQRRRESAMEGEIPFRPDHGHLLTAEPLPPNNPGYSYLGRLKGLAELRGVIAAFGHQAV